MPFKRHSSVKGLKSNEGYSVAMSKVFFKFCLLAGGVAVQPGRVQAIKNLKTSYTLFLIIKGQSKFA